MLKEGNGRPWLFSGARPVNGARAIRDVIAGVTLAAMSVPQVLGYARIAGVPLVTGLYTLLLPVVVFAALGSSRYLVVAADSATAALLAGTLARMAPLASEHYLELAGTVALLTAGSLVLARLLKFGFLADFLSQTVLVGFLTGVGVQVCFAMLGDTLGVPVQPGSTPARIAQLVSGISQLHAPTLSLSAAVVVIILVVRRVAPRWPAALFVVAAAIAASAAFDFSGRGIALIAEIAGGLPSFGLPHASWTETRQLLPLVGSCFLVIVAQSAATARAYASRHHEVVDEDKDLLGLAAANAAAALSGAFVVNGSPTQTAMVERSGGSSQVTNLTAAAVAGLVLLAFTGPLHYLPRCVLGSVVLTIAVGLIDVRSLRAIRRESPGEFGLALITAAVVVAIGIEEGIVLAIALSLFRHVRHSYRPHTAVLVEDQGVWRPTPAVAGARSGAGLVVFQFGADLFYANAMGFAADVRALAEGEGPPVKWMVVDAGAITQIDYSAARVVEELHRGLAQRGVALAIVHADASLRSDLQRHRLTDIIGADRIFDSLRQALATIAMHP